MTIDIRAHYDLSFDTLQNLHYLEEKVIPLGALFRATLGIIDTIAKADEGFSDTRRRLNGQNGGFNLMNRLDSFAKECRGPITGQEILQKRIRGILELVCLQLTLQTSDFQVCLI